MIARPSGLSRMNLISPPSFFLSTSHQLEPAIGAEVGRRRPAGRPPRPAADPLRGGGVEQPEARATGRPPSPCRSRPPRRAATRRSRARASIAWPKVWPKLSMARRPPSRSSCAHHVGLDLARARDRVRQRVRVARPQARRCCASIQSKKPASTIAPCLITSARPADSSRSGSVSSVSVSARSRARLVERADHVLAERVVDAGLAAHRGVDLRQQRGRHLHEAARRACSMAAAKPVMSPITPPPSATSVVLRSAPAASSASMIRCNRGHCLCGSPSGRMTGRNLGELFQRATGDVRIKRRDDGAADEQHARRRKRCDELSRALQQVVADQDVVLAARQADGDAMHR